MDLINMNLNGIEIFGEIAGFVFSYFLFTIILFDNFSNKEVKLTYFFGK